MGGGPGQGIRCPHAGGTILTGLQGEDRGVSIPRGPRFRTAPPLGILFAFSLAPFSFHPMCLADVTELQALLFSLEVSSVCLSLRLSPELSPLLPLGSRGPSVHEGDPTFGCPQTRDPRHLPPLPSHMVPRE